MMIKYSFEQDEEYVAVKEDEYDDLARANKNACRAYQEIFCIMDEGWMVTELRDIKVKSLKEKKLADETTKEWRKKLPFDDDKIHITKLETHLCSLTNADWEFQVGVVFFSIFAQGNKYGTINERFIPLLPSTELVSQMDWYSYVIECMVKESTNFNSYSYSVDHYF
ncbi:hypothetical protein Tco_0913678 [Tanacetum coccineum]